MSVGICFGGYCPMHQGHLDAIMRAKKENDCCYVVVCGYDDETRAVDAHLPLKTRYSLVKKLFHDDEQIRVLQVDDTELGIDESMSPDNWQIWTSQIARLIDQDVKQRGEESFFFQDSTHYFWYVGEQKYQDDLQTLQKSSILQNHPKITHPQFSSVVLMDKTNRISAEDIREFPTRHWDKIAWPFRPFFSANILITGTASEGKSTLTRDIANYFNLLYVEEFARTYMIQNEKADPELTVSDFREFLIEQRRDLLQKVGSRANNGVVVSDTDNVVTLMYAKSYADDANIDMTQADYESLYALAQGLKNEIVWNKIFLLPPKNDYVDDGCRYMNQSSMDERNKNFKILLDLLEEFGWRDRVEVLNGGYWENFLRVKNYIDELYGK